MLAIEATWRLLEDQANFPLLSMPGDNRRLVEAGVVIDQLEQLAQTLGGVWPKHLQSLFGKPARKPVRRLIRWHVGTGPGATLPGLTWAMKRGRSWV